MRVSTSVPSQTGQATSRRASVQRTCPSGSSATSSSRFAATTKRPCGDHDAYCHAPMRRRAPSASTIQVPPRSLESTSSLPGAGRDRSAGDACSTPTARRTCSKTARPRRGAGVRSSNARRTTSQARSSGVTWTPGNCLRSPIANSFGSPIANSFGSSTANSCESRSCLQLLEAVEPTAQPRVDGAAGEVEQLGDLARRVLEHVAQDDHGAVLRRELRDPPEGGAVGDRRGRRGEGVAELDLGAQPARPRPVDGAVDDDPVQPRSERAAAIEAVEVADGGQERLLRDVLGGSGVAGDEPRCPERPRPVLAEEPFEVGHRPALGAPDPAALVVGHASTVRRRRFTRSIRAGDLDGSPGRIACMRRLTLLLALLAAPAALTASARGAGCSPLDCAPTGSALGHGLFAVRPHGVTGPVAVDDLRTGRSKWQLPAGIVGGTTLVHQDDATLTWFDVVTGRPVGTAAVRGAKTGYLAGVSVDGSRAVLDYTAKRGTAFTLVSRNGQRTVALRGTSWAFDSLAGQKLYLLRYRRNGYQVRLYDLAADRLVAQPLKDPHESALIWGTAWGRVSSPDGRYVFTLYVAQDGGAMVHELDVRRATARCVELPGSGDFNRGTSYTLQVSRDGRTVWAVSPGFGRVVAIDVAAARVRSAFRFRPDSTAADSPSASVSALSADGRRLAVGLGRKVWLIDTARRSVVLASRRPATALAFSPDGRRLWLAGGASGQVLRAVPIV